MATKVETTFEVTNWDEKPFDERPDTPKLTTARVTKTYTGGIEGESVTEWLMAYAPDGAATFVGIERINGSIAGRDGTLVLQHVGAYADGSATAELTVLDQCGSGALAGVAGRGDFVADPSGRITFQLEL